MQKSAFERTGLVPRSIIRTFDRFRRQLLPGAEDLVIQEFRVSKYQVLVSVRCLASLLFFPLLVNYLVKTTILIPLAEYIWNTQQNEIFLNFYQENRAFLEMRDFEEKTFFESLISLEPRQSNYNSLVSYKIRNDFELIPIKSPKIITFQPVNKKLSGEALQTKALFSPSENLEIDFNKRNLNLSKISRERENFINLPQTPKMSKKTLFLETLNSQNSIKNCNSQNGTFNYIPNLKDLFFNLLQKKEVSKFLTIESKELNSKRIDLDKLNLVHVAKQNVEPKYKSDKVLSNLSVTNPKFSLRENPASRSETFFIENEKEIIQDYDCTFYKTRCKQDTIFQKNQGLTPKSILGKQLYDNHKVFVGEHFVSQNVEIDFGKQKEEAAFFAFTKNNSLSFENKENPKTNEIDEVLLQKKFQEKTIQLAAFYNQQTISAIANVFGDFVTLITIAFLFVLMKPQIIILKSFLTESIYSLSDTTKSFLLILLTDLLVGFHSPRGWEILIEILLRHFGLPENQDFVFLFVATLPVLLDTVFKYWIFRYLNQISPSTVATYHSMIE